MEKIKFALDDDALFDEAVKHGLLVDKIGEFDCYVTALEIINQMPVGTSLSTMESTTGEPLWECNFGEGFRREGRQDKSPHIAAAIAFIEWKTHFSEW